MGEGPQPQPSPFEPDAGLFGRLLDHAATASFLVTPAGALLYANRAFGELTGYDIRMIGSVGLEQIVHPDDLGNARNELRDLAAGAIERGRCERRFVRKNGEPVWILSSSSAVGDAAGQSIILMQALDIDAGKRAAQAQAVRERRWSHALDSAGQGVWDHDFRHGTIFYSRTWRLMRGMTADAPVDGALDAWLRRVHRDDRDRIRDIVVKQDTGEIPYNAFEYRERHRDGHYMWILSRGRPVEWFPDGKPSRILGTDTDITSLKRVEEELASEKERLRVTLRSIGDGVISTDANGRITFMNPVAESMTGWQSDQAVGRRVEDVFAIVNETTGEPVPDPVAECLRRKETYYLDDDVLLVGRNGERRDVRDSAAPVRTPSGEIIGAVLVFQDVTQSRVLQRELAHSARHDSLTGLPNRAAFEIALSAALDQARTERRQHVLCFIDLDHFKNVNDGAGHAAGDALLLEIGAVIRHGSRPQDFTARIGGDEFALILADCSLRDAESVAGEIVEAIGLMRFAWHGAEYRLGASVGLAAISPTARDCADIMSRADAACYAAKARGRNTVAVDDGTMTEAPHQDEQARAS